MLNNSIELKDQSTEENQLDPTLQVSDLSDGEQLNAALELQPTQCGKAKTLAGLLKVRFLLLIKTALSDNWHLH